MGAVDVGRMSRNKGAAYERHLAKIFQGMGFDNAKRHLEFQGQEAEEGRDLDGTQPFAVQAKCWGKTPSISAINQVMPTDSYPLPVAVLKRTQSKGVKGLEVAVMPLDLFVALIKTLYDAGIYSYPNLSEDDAWVATLRDLVCEYSEVSS